MELSVFSRAFFVSFSKTTKYLADNISWIIDETLQPIQLGISCCNHSNLQNCILGHNHAVLYCGPIKESSKDFRSGISLYLSKFPSLDVCKSVLEELRQGEGSIWNPINLGSETAKNRKVVWKEYGIFERCDIERIITIVKNITDFSQYVSDLMLLRNSHYYVPPSATSLENDVDCEEFFNWFCNKPLLLSNNSEIESRYQLDNYYTIINEKRVPYHDQIVRFTGTHCIGGQEILLVLQILNYQNPSDLYILLDPYWSDEQFLHFLENVLMKRVIRGKVHIIVNRYGEKVNVSGFYGHWVYYCIMEIPGIILYGDSMPRSILVKNVDKYISMIYEKRHGELENVNLFDISSHPNYPKQPNDSEICGRLSLLLAMVSVDNNSWQSIVSTIKEENLSWLRNSPLFKVHIAFFFQKCIIRSEVNINWLFKSPSHVHSVYDDIYDSNPTRVNIFKGIKYWYRSCAIDEANVFESSAVPSTVVKTSVKEKDSCFTSTVFISPDNSEVVEKVDNNIFPILDSSVDILLPISNSSKIFPSVSLPHLTITQTVTEGKPQSGNKCDLEVHYIPNSIEINTTIAISESVDLLTLDGYHWKSYGDKNRKRKTNQMRRALIHKFICLSENCVGEYQSSNVYKVAVKIPYRLIRLIKEHSISCREGKIRLYEENIFNSVPNEIQNNPLNSLNVDEKLSDKNGASLKCDILFNSSETGNTNSNESTSKIVSDTLPSEHDKLPSEEKLEFLDSSSTIIPPVLSCDSLEDIYSLNDDTYDICYDDDYDVKSDISTKFDNSPVQVFTPSTCVTDNSNLPEESIDNAKYAMPSLSIYEIKTGHTEVLLHSDESSSSDDSLLDQETSKIQSEETTQCFDSINPNEPSRCSTIDKEINYSYKLPSKSVHDTTVISVNLESCPLRIKGESLLHVPDISKKTKVRCDFGTWGKGSNYKGVTTYKCKNSGCIGRKYNWICHGKCHSSETKDVRCCKHNNNNGSSLFIKYTGEHNCGFYNFLGKNLEMNLHAEDSVKERAETLYGKSVLSVALLPENIPEDAMFIINCNDPFPGKKIHQYVNDGRSYTKNKTFNKKITNVFSSIAKVHVFNYSCRGSYICNNLGCSYFQRFNVANQFVINEKDVNEKICSTCSFPLDKLPCMVKKLVAFQDKGKDQTNNEIFVRYEGFHVCLAKYKIQEKTKQEVEEYFQQNPNVKPSIAWYNMWSKKMREGASTEELDQIILTQVNDWLLSNSKAKVRKQINPHYSVMGAIEDIRKQYVENESVEKYGIIMDIIKSSNFCYSCNKVLVEENANNETCGCNSDDYYVNTGEFIFLTSKTCLETMMEMDYGKTLYGNSCHVDHQPGRTKEYTTFEGVMYDSDLQRIVTLFTFHMEQETEFHVACAFVWLDRVLSKHISPGARFNPHGFVSDEAGGLLAGLLRIHPEIPVVTDDFHFKQNVYQLVSRDIGSNNDIIRYLRFCQALQNAISPTVYEKLLKVFIEWITLINSREKRVLSFIEWWDKRRSHWSKAFKNNAVEKHSLAESGNSMVARKSILKNVSIDECVRFEICQLMKHFARIKSLLNGTYKLGRGPSRKVLQERKINALNERVRLHPTTKEESDKLISDIFETIGIPMLEMFDCDDSQTDRLDDPFVLLEEDIEKRNEKVKVRSTSQHNYKPNILNAKKLKKVGRPRNSKKSKVSFNDSLEEDSDSGDELRHHANDGKIKKMCVPNTKTLPKNWKWVEKKVMAMFVGPESYTIEYLDELIFSVSKLDEKDKHRTVSFMINRTGCSCEDFQKKQNSLKDPARKLITFNCKHIIFVMMKLGVDRKDNILSRHHMNAEDIRILTNLKNNWLCNEEVTEKIEVDSVEKNVSGNHAEYAGDSLKSAQEKLKTKKIRWSAVYFKRKNNRGRRPRCQSSNSEPHALVNEQMTLKVEFYIIFKPTGRDIYMLKSEEKYFCCRNNCINYPKSGFSNPTFSNYRKPSIKDIVMDGIDAGDYDDIERLELK